MAGYTPKDAVTATTSLAERYSHYGPADKRRILLLLLLFALWSWLANAGMLSGFDRAGLLFFREPGDTATVIDSPWLADMALGFSHVGGTVALIVLSLGLVGYVGWREGAGRCFTYVAAIGGGMLIVTVFKDLFERARPEIVRHLMHETSASFPSGHATRSTIVYLIVALFLGQLFPAYRRTVTVLALCLAFGVGLSRVIVGVHWPSDVIGGWILALFWVALLLPQLRVPKP